MGANYVSRTFKACDVPTLNQQISTACEEDRSYYGHQEGYCGSWGGKIGEGTHISSQTFVDGGDAEDYLSETTSKFGPLVAVKVSAPGKAALAQMKRLHKQQEALANKLRDADKAIKTFEQSKLEQVRNGKSTRRTCKACGSAIATKYVRSDQCGICGDPGFLYSATDRKRLAALQAKVIQLTKQVREKEADITEVRRNTKPTNKWFWIVGGWCPC